MPLSWRAAAVTLDAGTALCAAFNLTYFLDRLLADGETPRRRVAAFALALVSLGVLLESLVFLATAERALPPVSAPWALVRLVPFAGAAVISGLVLRRVVSGSL